MGDIMILEISLLIFAAASVAVVMLKDLLHAVIVMAAADAVLAFVFFLLGAPDIAMTQVAVTAGLTTIIFLVAIGKTRRMEEHEGGAGKVHADAGLKTVKAAKGGKA